MFVACQKKSNLAYYRVYKNHASSDEHTGEKQKRKDILHTKDTINTINPSVISIPALHKG
ncbi:hypothetical protein JHK85_057376 [Glycine max]|uniref:Uncharacterized protein n=1 Tax=Glycine soja TaxID=3848 RepID=A0A0B2R485_GLYSO|nr:hypothetical protein JHK85_057376 [Glycine max]KHN26667.1 hypothetical protein glysoja_041491 [Glycine soja]